MIGQKPTTKRRDQIMNDSNIDLQNSIGGLSVRRAFVLTAFLVAWFVCSPMARAVTPAPDGGYPNHNTAEGQDALFSWPNTTLDGENTAIGFEALYNDNDGTNNTAAGSGALYSN